MSTLSVNLEGSILNGGATYLNGGPGTGAPYLNGGPGTGIHTLMNGGPGTGVHTICNGSMSTLPRYGGNDGNHLLRELGDIDEQVSL